MRLIKSIFLLVILLSAEMLGHDGDIKWEHHPDSLRVTFPKEKPCTFAYGLKIHLTQTPGKEK